MSKRAKKPKPVKLAVGQRWVFEGRDPSWDDIVTEVGRKVRALPVGESSSIEWTHTEFRAAHPRLRDPSELESAKAFVAEVRDAVERDKAESPEALKADRDRWKARFEAQQAAFVERDQLRADAESRTAGLELQLAAAREQYEAESHRSAVELGQYREELRVLMRRLLAEMARGGGA